MGTPNFSPSTIWIGDNLPILRGMNSECVDLIYLDPPFNAKAEFSAPIGSQASGANFKDIWKLTDIKEEWIELFAINHPPLYRILQSALTESNKSYLAFMAIRILEIHRILKPTGSVYLHCDPTMSHWLKIVMDYVFGVNNFRNEIIWSYRTGGSSKKFFAKKHDVILFYSKTEKYTFNLQKEKAYTKSKNRKAGIVEYGPGRAAEFLEDGNGVYTLVNMRDVWDISYINSQAKERTGYPTQKPVALLERIIQSSSNEGDLVLDPFCGCATTLVAAESNKRKWSGIDICENAVEILGYRIYTHDKIVRSDKLDRTDLGKLPNPRSMEVREKLYGKQKGYCAGCEKHFELRNLEVDHIIAKAVGGNGHENNLQLLCGACNRTKGKRGMKYLKSKLYPDDF